MLYIARLAKTAYLSQKQVVALDSEPPFLLIEIVNYYGYEKVKREESTENNESHEEVVGGDGEVVDRLQSDTFIGVHGSVHDLHPPFEGRYLRQFIFF